MEIPPRSFDVCIVCALQEEASAFIEVVKQYGKVPLEECMSPRYRYSYRFATIKNHKDEPLRLHISWPPQVWTAGNGIAFLTRSGGVSALYGSHDWYLCW